MKRRILSLLLVLALLVTVSVFAVEATDPETPAVDPNPTKTSFDAAVAEHGEADTLDFYCEACGSVQTWTKVTSTTVPNKRGAGGHAYVASSENGQAVGQQIVGVTSATEMSATIEVEGERYVSFCLYMNGDMYRNIESTNKKNMYLFRLYSDYTGIDTTIPCHVTMNVMGNGTARMYTTGTPVKKDSSTGPQNGVCINLSTNDTYPSGGTCTLNIYEGAVIGNQGSVSSNGVVSAQQAYHTINMFGGRIDGGTPKGTGGGAVYITAGSTFNMHGGEIHGSDIAGLKGGAVYMAANAATTFNMGTDPEKLNTEHLPAIYGGTTTGNGAGVYINVGTFNMGAGTLSGGTANGYGGTLFVTGSNSKVNMFGGEIIGGTCKSTSYGGGGVNINSSGTFNMYKGATITGGISEGYTGGSVYLNSGGKFNMYGGEIVGGQSLGKSWGTGSAVAVHTSGADSSRFNMYGGTITDDENTKGTLVYAYTSTSATVDSVITIDESVELPANAPVGAEKDAKALINVNNKVRAVQANRSAVVLNAGTLVGGENVTVVGATLYLTASTCSMKDGTIRNGNTSDNGGNIYMVNASEFTMDGGEILSGTAKGSGGNVYLDESTFTMNKGTIALGTSSKHGGNVYLCGGATFTMNDGCTIAAGTLKTAGDSNFGGNIGMMHTNTFTMNGGLMTTVYGDVTGNARHGDNIGLWNDGSDAKIELLGGEIAVGSGTGGVVYLASTKENGASVKIGAVKITGENGNNSDIYAYKTGMGQKITVTDGFEDDLLIYIEGGETPVIADKKVNTIYAAAEGYTKSGKIVIHHDGQRFPVVGNGTEFVLAEAALLDGQNILVGGTYADVTAAYAENKGEANAQNYIKLFNMDGQTITAAEGDVIDVNGNNVTVDSAAAVAVIDSATNDYDDTDAAKITFANAVGTGADVNLTINGQQGTRRYALIKNDDGTYGAHRFYITQRNVGIRVNEDDAAPDLIYSGSFRGTQTFAANVEAFGIDFQHEGASLYKVNYLDHEQAFTSGNMIYGKNVNIVVSEQAAKDGYGEKLIKGVPYITLKGGVELTAQVIEEATSVKAQVESFKANYATLSDSQKAIYDAMVEQSGALFTTLGWDYAVA